MAFPRAAGHGNLPQGNFTPVVYSQKVLKFFRRASVVEDITNTDYYGEIANFGDTVKVIKEPIVTVADYSRGQTVNIQDLDDDETTLTVDKSKYFAFRVDDIEVKHAHVNWEELASSGGAYALRDSYDREVLAYMITQAPAANTYGSSGSPKDTGFDTGEFSPLHIMNRLSRLLDEQNIPSENRWLVAQPIFWEQMMEESSKLMGVDFTGDSSSILRNGKVTNGLIRGFRCYRTNNLVPTSNSYPVLAGHMSSTATVSQITKTEVLRSENTFADVVRGLHLYGRKTFRPESLALAWCSFD